MAELKITMAAARVNAGLTQGEIARLMGVGKTTIVNWEKGHTVPSVERFRRFCEICGIKSDDVLLPKFAT